MIFHRNQNASPSRPRRAIHFIAMSSALIVTIAVVALWLRSYSREDSIGRDWPYQIDQLLSQRGRLYYQKITFVSAPYRDPNMINVYPPRWYRKSKPLVSYDYLGGENFLGFAYTQRETPGVGRTTGGSDWFVSIPHGLIVLLGAIVCIIFFRRWRRVNFRAGFCRTCGYDLRATPDRCPECGTTTD